VRRAQAAARQTHHHLGASASAPPPLASGRTLVAWEGREHSALDDAVNTARLACALVERGVKLTATGVAAGWADGDGGGGGGGGPPSSAAAAAAGGGAPPPPSASANPAPTAPPAPGPAPAPAPKPHPHPPQQRQLTLAPKKPPPPAYDPSNPRRWLGRCRCGVDVQRRVVRRPGPTNGKTFFSCGKWSLATSKGECEFFLWADAGRKGRCFRWSGRGLAGAGVAGRRAEVGAREEGGI